MKTKAKGRALTEKQKRYCRLRADGESRRAAYKGAGYSGDGKTANDNAYNLETRSAKSTAILQRIAELQQRVEDGAIMDRSQRQALLTELAQDEEGARADRIRALDLLNKMCGDYTERVIYEGNSHVSIEDARAEAWDSLKSE